MLCASLETTKVPELAGRCRLRLPVVLAGVEKFTGSPVELLVTFAVKLPRVVEFLLGLRSVHHVSPISSTSCQLQSAPAGRQHKTSMHLSVQLASRERVKFEDHWCMVRNEGRRLSSSLQ